MLDLFEKFTEEDWELLVLCMIKEVYHLELPRFKELMDRLERMEEMGAMYVAIR